MILPKDNAIYEYEGKKYRVLGKYFLTDIIAQDIIEDNDPHSNSHFHKFSWWKFTRIAKFIGYNKLNSAY